MTTPDEPQAMALHVRIRGQVQGVFFRRWIQEQATRRGLRGWVRNRSDGTVEAVFSGEMATVRALARDCRQGPPKAQVRQVVQIPGEFCPADDDFDTEFKILPTV